MKSNTCDYCKNTVQDHEMIPDGTVEGTVDERPRRMDNQGRLCDSEVRIPVCKRCNAASCPFPACENCYELYGPLDFSDNVEELERKTVRAIRIYPKRTEKNLGPYESTDELYREQIGWVYYCHACAEELNIKVNSILY